MYCAVGMMNIRWLSVGEEECLSRAQPRAYAISMSSGRNFNAANKPILGLVDKNHPATT